MIGFFVDVLDPDWTSFESVMERRQNYFASMRYLEELSRTLTRQAEEDQERRQAVGSAADRERRENRVRTLRQLVLRANATADPVEADRLWASVDAMVRPGAP